MKERLTIIIGKVLIGFAVILFLIVISSLSRQIKELKRRRALPDICRRCSNSTHSGYVCTYGLQPEIYLRGSLLKEVVEECERFKEKLSTTEVERRHAQFKPGAYRE